MHLPNLKTWNPSLFQIFFHLYSLLLAWWWYRRPLDCPWSSLRVNFLFSFFKLIFLLFFGKLYIQTLLFLSSVISTLVCRWCRLGLKLQSYFLSYIISIWLFFYNFVSGEILYSVFCSKWNHNFWKHFYTSYFKVSVR